VALQALRIANLASQVGERKAVAARVADRILGELAITGQLPDGESGTILEGVHEFHWAVELGAWPEGSMQLATVRVTYQVQGQEYEVTVSTLTDVATL